MNKLPVKVFFDQTYRKIQLVSPFDTTSSLLNQLSNCFHVNIKSLNDFELQYLDCENDWITFDSDNEWKQAIESFELVLMSKSASTLSLKMKILKREEPVDWFDTKQVNEAKEEIKELQVEAKNDSALAQSTNDFVFVENDIQEVDVIFDIEKLANSSNEQDVEVNDPEQLLSEVRDLINKEEHNVFDLETDEAPEKTEEEQKEINDVETPEQQEEIKVEQEEIEQEEIEQEEIEQEEIEQEETNSFIPKIDEIEDDTENNIDSLLEESDEFEFEREMRICVDMGLDDESLLRNLLLQNKGNVTTTVSTYFSKLSEKRDESKEFEFEEQLSILTSMGFDNKQKLMTLLIQNKGDVQQTLSNYLG